MYGWTIVTVMFVSLFVLIGIDSCREKYDTTYVKKQMIEKITKHQRLDSLENYIKDSIAESHKIIFVPDPVQ